MFLQLYDEGSIPVKALTSRRNRSNISRKQANMVSVRCNRGEWPPFNSLTGGEPGPLRATVTFRLVAGGSDGR